MKKPSESGPLKVKRHWGFYWAYYWPQACSVPAGGILFVEPRCGAVHHPTNTGHFTPQSAGLAQSLDCTDASASANARFLRSQSSGSEGKTNSFLAPDDKT
jgi:hypothetical protein